MLIESRTEPRPARTTRDTAARSAVTPSFSHNVSRYAVSSPGGTSRNG